MDGSPNKLARVKALRNRKGIQYLINEASKIIGNPILMHDLDYKAIACTQNVVTDDPLWNELVETGRHGQKTIELLKEEQLIDIAADSKATVFLASERLKYRRIFSKVYNKDNITVAGVNIVECHKPFDEGDVAAFEAFCNKISKEVGRDEYYQTYGQMYQESLIAKLIDGVIEDRRLYPVHVESLYHGMKNNLFLAVVDVSQCSNAYANPEYCKNACKQTQPAFKYSVYSGYVLVIISADTTQLDVKKDLRNLNRLFEQNNMYVGISSCFENMYELQKYYNEALSVLKNGIGSSEDQRVFLHA